MTRPVVFLARRIPSIGIKTLASVAEVRMHDGGLPPTRAELLHGVIGCSGILSMLDDRIDCQVMDAAGDQLRVISNFAVGTNNIDRAEAKRRGIAVGNTPDVLTGATADIAVGLLLAAARQFRSAMRAAEDGSWRTWEPLGWLGYELEGKTVGIVGFGRIGLAVAKRLYGGWGMRVLYTSRHSREASLDGIVAERVSLDRLMAESDFVSLHVPLTEETRHLISRPQLECMQPHAVLVNTSRGEVVDQLALIEALRAKRIFAAGLDVCTPEPLPTEHALHSLPNCLLLPHIGSATLEARNAMALRAATNILQGVQGKPLPFPV